MTSPHTSPSGNRDLWRPNALERTMTERLAYVQLARVGGRWPAVVPHTDRTPPSAADALTPDGPCRNAPSHVQERGTSDEIGPNSRKGKLTNFRRVGYRSPRRFRRVCVWRRGGSGRSGAIHRDQPGRELGRRLRGQRRGRLLVADQ